MVKSSSKLRCSCPLGLHNTAAGLVVTVVGRGFFYSKHLCVQHLKSSKTCQVHETTRVQALLSFTNTQSWKTKTCLTASCCNMGHTDHVRWCVIQIQTRRFEYTILRSYESLSELNYLKKYPFYYFLYDDSRFGLVGGTSTFIPKVVGSKHGRALFDFRFLCALTR